MNGSLASTPLAQRRAFVRSLSRTLDRVARRRRRGRWEARCWLKDRLGLSLRGWQDLSAGRVHRVPAVALERLAKVEGEAR